MLRLISFISVLIYCFLFISCEHKKDHDHAAGDHDSQTSEALENINNLLHLDGGQKWQMDEHTRTVITKMSASFSAADRTSLHALKQSGQELQNHIAELIKGCTMTGVAHEQLHVFLAVYIPSVQSLSAASDMQAAETAAKNISGLLNDYTKYFE